MTVNSTIITPAHTDLTFFTNEPGATLLDRFRETFKYVKYLEFQTSTI